MSFKKLIFHLCAGKETYCTDSCAGNETYCTDPWAGKEIMALIHGREKKSWHSSTGGKRVFSWMFCDTLSCPVKHSPNPQTSCTRPDLSQSHLSWETR